MLKKLKLKLRRPTRPSRTPKKDVLFIIGDLNAEVRSQEILAKQANLALEYGMKQGKG